MYHSVILGLPCIHVPGAASTSPVQHPRPRCSIHVPGAATIEKFARLNTRLNFLFPNVHFYSSHPFPDLRMRRPINLQRWRYIIYASCLVPPESRAVTITTLSKDRLQQLTTDSATAREEYNIVSESVYYTPVSPTAW